MEPFAGFSLSKGVRFLLIATFCAWIVELIPAVDAAVINSFALVPSKAIGHGQIWRLVTYLFLHDPYSPWHVIFNMYGLWVFGVEIEKTWGTKRFVIFYFLSGAVAGLFSIFFWNSVIIGASGAILALLTVYACYFPHATILLFFIIPLPAYIAVIVIGAISLWGARVGAGNIGHLSHLGGIVFGFLYFKYHDAVVQRLQTAGSSQRTRTRPTILPFTRKEEGGDESSSDKEEIDRILDKISRQGMQSLTKSERKTLLSASKRNK